MNIIAADVSHLDHLLPLFLGYLEFYKVEREAEDVWGFLEERLANQESIIYLAVTDEGEAVGFVQLYPSFSSLSLKRQWILNDLFVLPEFRRQKVARALLKKADELAVATNARGLSLMTAVDNAPAQRLYQDLGWKQVKQFLTFTKTF
jgi:ribosomal protein S18 acetylase RimI-like enzyme